MATEGPLAIEAPRQDPGYIVNENELSVVPVATPGPVIPRKQPIDSSFQQPATSYCPEGGRQEIPPGLHRSAASPASENPPPPYSASRIIASGEHQSQHTNIETEREIKRIGNTAVQDQKTTRFTDKVERQQAVCMHDDQGNIRMVTRTITEERTITVTEISQVLCNEIQGVQHNPKSNVRAIRGTARQEDHEAKATCGEKTIDLCCQSLVCHFQNPFRKNATAVERKQLMNATRRRGRAKGWTILKGLIFPFVSDVARDFWVFVQLIFASIMFSLSASTFTLVGENYEIFHAVHLALSTLAAFLAILDSIVSYTQCSTCRACISCCRKKIGRKKSEDPNTETPTTGNNEETEYEKTKSSSCDPKKCRKCFKASRSILDIARVLLTEFILIPIIFCDMFEVATGKGFSSDVTYHRLGFALMVYDSIGLIVFVFLLRLVILGRMIRAEQKMHPTEKEIYLIQKINEEKGTQTRDYNLDASIKENSLKIQIVFFLHVFGQTLTHALMLVAVGAKVAYDTRSYSISSIFNQFNFTTATGVNTDVTVSPYLWYMMVAAYVLPTFGIGTFFIVNNYWVQQFLIGLCIDFVTLLQICEDSNLISWQDEKPSEAIGKFVRMSGRRGMRSLPAEYEDMREISFCEKVGYPFKSPGLVIVCMFYAACQLAFVLCGVYAINNMARIVVIYLNGGGWSIYVFVATAVGVVINIYSFLIAGFWIMIIALVIAAIVLLIICCICLFCLAGACSN